MNIDFNESQNLNKSEIEQVQKQKEEYKLIEKILRKRGLKLFAYNQQKDEIFEINIPKDINDTIYLKTKEGKLVIDYDKTYEKATIDPRNIHFESLNYKNALKRVENFKAGKIKKLDNLRRFLGNKIEFF